MNQQNPYKQNTNFLFQQKMVTLYAQKTDVPLQVSLDLSIQESPTLIPRIEENTTVGHNFLVE